MLQVSFALCLSVIKTTIVNGSMPPPPPPRRLLFPATHPLGSSTRLANWLRRPRRRWDHAPFPIWLPLLWIKAPSILLFNLPLIKISVSQTFNPSSEKKKRFRLQYVEMTRLKMGSFLSIGIFIFFFSVASWQDSHSNKDLKGETYIKQFLWGSPSESILLHKLHFGMGMGVPHFVCVFLSRIHQRGVVPQTSIRTKKNNSL